MLGKFRHRRKIDVFNVGKWNFGVVAIVSLEFAGIVIAGKIEIVEAWDNATVNDLDNIRLFLVLRHSVDSRSIFG